MSGKLTRAELADLHARLGDLMSQIPEPCTCEHARISHIRRSGRCTVPDCYCTEWWSKT